MLLFVELFPNSTVFVNITMWEVQEMCQHPAEMNNLHISKLSFASDKNASDNMEKINIIYKTSPTESKFIVTTAGEILKW